MFPKISGGNFLYDRVRNLFHLLAKEAYIGTGEALLTKLSTREATRVHLTGALGRVYENLETEKKDLRKKKSFM